MNQNQAVGKSLVQPSLEERVTADPKARVKLVMLFLGAIALYFFWDRVFDYLTPLDESSPTEDLIAATRIRTIVMFGFFEVLSIYSAYGFFRMAQRIRKSGQFPAPGASVPFSTVIKRGKEAQTAAVGYFLMAGASVVSAVTILLALIVILYLL